jgi:hypothetical protein
MEFARVASVNANAPGWHSTILPLCGLASGPFQIPRSSGANGGAAAEMTQIAEIVLHFMTMQDLRINATGLG